MSANLFRDLNMVFHCNCTRPAQTRPPDGADQLRIPVACLPIENTLEFDDLNVDSENTNWNIFIIGGDRTYISVSVRDDPAGSGTFEVLKVGGVTPNHLLQPVAFCFNRIWDVVMKGDTVHKFMLLHNILYVLSAFPLKNTTGDTCGGVLFMRRSKDPRYLVLDGKS
jgi:hypothetical protein